MSLYGPYLPKRWVWLTELVQKHGWTTGVEVGVKEGENLFYVLDHCPGLSMTGIDPWVVQPGCTETYDSWGVDSMYERVRTKAEKYNGRCKLIRDFSVPAAEAFTDKVDFVFIDAMHDYEHMIQDIAAWRDKCTFLSGHDFWDQFPGVVQAVRESIPADRLIIGPNTCWATWVGGE